MNKIQQEIMCLYLYVTMSQKLCHNVTQQRLILVCTMVHRLRLITVFKVYKQPIKEKNAFEILKDNTIFF